MPTSTDQNRDAAIEVVEYDPLWPEQFAAERRLLETALGAWLAGPIEHVGSTAIVGMVAKPVIDIMVPVVDLPSSKGAIAAAQALHYNYWPYKADLMHWFCKPSPVYRTHHLHIVPLGSALWKERLLFRDTLRTDSRWFQEYAVLKRRLAQQYRNDREAYTEAKGAFVQRVLLCAGAAPKATNI